MIVMSGILVFFVIAFFIARWLTNRLYWKFYKMAELRNKADVFESIVRVNRYVLPMDLHRAYQEAIHS